MKRKLLAVSFFVGVLLLSCKSCDIVSGSKKGHLGQAPNITFGELVNRYQFIDTASVKWDSITDSNNNVFVEVSAQFDNGLGILFNSLQTRIYSGEMDITVLMYQKHNFFDSLLNEEGFRVEDDSSSYMSLRFNIFEPDYGDPGTPSFFSCNGGTLALNCTVDKKGLVRIENATLVFDMQSPMRYSGDVSSYQLIYPVDAEIVENMLVNNTDIRIGT
jgi:hypothetical protein